MPDVEKDDPEIKRRGRETLAELQMNWMEASNPDHR